MKTLLLVVMLLIAPAAISDGTFVVKMDDPLMATIFDALGWKVQTQDAWQSLDGLVHFWAWGKTATDTGSLFIRYGANDWWNAFTKPNFVGQRQYHWTTDAIAKCHTIQYQAVLVIGNQALLGEIKAFKTRGCP